MTRRSFLRKTIKSFFLILSASFSLLLLFFVYPIRIREKQIVFLEILSEEALPRRGVKKVDFRYTSRGREIKTRAFLVNHLDRIFAFSPVCTHLGCLVNWNRHKNKFLCPCHGGEYDIEGNVIAGPPPKALTKLQLKIEKEKVFIGIKV